MMAKRNVINLSLFETGSEKEPNAKIAELYGQAPDIYKDSSAGQIVARTCPVRNSTCDVTANRHQVAHLGLDNRKSITSNEAAEIRNVYGNTPLPLGICSCWTRRQNETEARPWILCPKRLLSLEPPKPVIPREVRQLFQIADGTRVGVWSELKLRHRERENANNRFFEYTFDYLLMGLDETGNPTGAPYIIEVMTSSTRGGGLTEHMVDVLLGRNQRHLGEVVDSVYTPNYRQVFERMLGQFIAKSEIAERWGGRTIWVFQDVLLDYIEQTTAFDSNKLTDASTGNVFAEVYRLEAPSTDKKSALSGLHLVHHKSLRGRARLNEHSADYTSFLGLGYAPPYEELIKTLKAGIQRHRSSTGRSENAMVNPTARSGRWFDFVWGDDIDPRESEKLSF
ncbi:MAG TPA: hypothetical protein VGF67_09750 [Ktedonobacteraceae bacterium]|jgi:hypothetical protein